MRVYCIQWAHTKAVKSHFAGSKQGRLLVIDVGESDEVKWQKLCDFLEVPKKDQPGKEEAYHRLVFFFSSRSTLSTLIVD